MTRVRWFWAGLTTLALAAPAGGQLPSRLEPAQFAALVERLSEPGGFFDTDNLVSNEDSYLHAVTGLRRLGVRGGVYIGVGPDQNFSYIAALGPAMAFMVDIRRDNLLEHLLFKAAFARSRSRVEYLGLLLGRPAPADTAGWGARGLDEVLRYMSGGPDSAAAQRARRVLRAAIRSFGVPLSGQDLATIGRFHDTFIQRGLDLRLTTFGRPERRDYPTYRELLRQTDLEGRPANFLVRESDFLLVKSLQDRNLVVPLVGDFAGAHALRALGRYLEERGGLVSAFYTSNVEQYLMGGGGFEAFAANLAALPHHQHSVIIRSYFPYGRPHPQAVAGYLSVQLLQRVTDLLADVRQGGYRGYHDLVTRNVLRPQ
ncbi:MAG TPA: hypothetical protein VD793_11100 [Gemmatimonadales bacterium]|nr:hypothetical protein [Gemmatimonadales bacterium]